MAVSPLRASFKHPTTESLFTWQVLISLTLVIFGLSSPSDLWRADGTGGLV